MKADTSSPSYDRGANASRSSAECQRTLGSLVKHTPDFLRLELAELPKSQVPWELVAANSEASEGFHFQARIPHQLPHLS